MANGLGSSKLVDISTALSTQGVVSVIGVVVDVFQGPWRSKGTSSCTTFTLKDSNLNNGHTWDGLKVKYFRDNESQLPPVREGDVKKFNGKPLGVAAQADDIPWAVFRRDSDPNSSAAPMCGPTPFEPSAIEKRLSLSLLELSFNIKRFRISSSETLPPQSYSAGPSASKTKHTWNKFTLIQDAQYETYVNLVGEVVKLYPHGGDKALIFERFSKRRWTGPSGQMSLSVTTWEPHATFVHQNVKEGDIVQLMNVHIKRSNLRDNMEAVIHGGNYNNRTFKVRIVNVEKDDRAKELLRRKEEYWNKKKRSKRKSQAGNEATKAPKKSNKKQKQKPEAKQEESQTSLAIKKRYATNKTTGNPGCSNRSIEDIITNKSHNNIAPYNIEYRFPFQNLCYRSTVRVVDYFPPSLEDFAVPNQEDTKRRVSNNYEDFDEGFTGWEWRFCLLVESSPPPAPGQPKEQMKLFVSSHDAEYLLHMDATDLRKNSVRLAQLREKLFLLWGNLEEEKRKSAEQTTLVPHNPSTLSSRPFTCCIKEYGVICSHRANTKTDPDNMSSDDDESSSCSHDGCFGWDRRFAMFYTSIQQ
ncbi:hypothetical protein EYZ11_012106 [Aspergillus tanneri]|uniref:Protection of telomeres protein 1 n=1 Tax=Aspergillus tanneri TaxID=1220188 RepID=A0A4S3J130_9EURO|nr:hypothetical protein EYZ11_012106 [Aspergillus tanneri]